MKKENVNYILIFASAFLLIFLTVGTLITPDVGLSENENRYLTEKPKLSVVNILDGSYEKRAEDYLSDQIIFRENWVRLMAGSLKLIGVKDLNGAYLLGGGKLAEKISPKDFDYRRYERNLKEVKKLSLALGDEEIKLDAMLVPTAAYSMKDKYGIRGFFDEERARKLAEKIIGEELLDITSNFDGADDLFYFSDHHWNSNGAYIAYERYAAERLGQNKPTYESLDLTTVTDKFRGTLYSKVLLDSVKKDAIKVPKSALETKTEFKTGGEKYDSIYFRDRLEKKDKYEFFLGGNYDRADIIIPGNENKPKLLIIKDSFANSFVPYLLEDFSEITLIDTRYYRGDVSELASDEGYDRVLILYSMSNFAKEKIKLNSALFS